ncbi:MAG: hypothetical protein H6600_06960 [Flavobacteriales bacterium]|nr:hypothetical protein [Flavobacteriales bacterium]
MKSLFIFILGLSVLMLTTCKKVDKFTQFNLTYSEQFTIPSSTGINLPFNFNCPDVETNSTQEFEVNDTRKDLIEEIKLITLVLNLDSPTSSDFSFLKSAEIYLNADGLSEVKVAYIEDVSDNVGTILDLTTTNADLQEYVKKDQLQLRLKVITDKVVTSDHIITAHATFYVDAKILGQ